jgi:cell division protein ZapA (FtsZ GTPase activity inhibitor)
MARTVKVTLLGRDFRLQTEDDEAFVQSVAALVDDRLSGLRSRLNLPTEHLALLAALNLAEDLQRERQQFAQLREQWAERIESAAALAERRAR